jgi:D-psicose/D-tagatose/L-ribulose 3-epimerase
MRFGAATFVWTSPFTTDDLAVLDRIAGAGFDVAEIALEDPSRIDPGRLREGLAARGLGARLLAFCTPDRDVSSADGDVQRAGLAYLREAIALAATVEADVVGGPIAHPPGRARALPAEERAAERRRAAQAIAAAADDAGAHGVRLAVEVLSRFDSDMLNTAEQGLAFCDEVGSPAAGVMLDTFHMNIEEVSCGDAIRLAGERLLHVHASESHRGSLGTGQVRWADVAAALRETGYDGVVSVESVSWDAEDLRGVVAMWRPWFTDADAFAADGLRFARSVLAA